MRIQKLLLLIILLMVVAIPSLQAQKMPAEKMPVSTEENEEVSVPEASESPQQVMVSIDTSNTTERSLDERIWHHASDGLNYNEAPGTEKKPEEKKDESSGLPVWLGYLLIGGLILSVLWILLKDMVFTKNKKLSEASKIRMEDLDEHIMETELDHFLRNALQNKDFKQAIRIYYLMVIKELNLRDWIRWKKDKTNRQYLMEMSERRDYSLFRQMTLIFENVWYGESNINEKDFHLISNEFREFLASLPVKK